MLVFNSENSQEILGVIALDVIEETRQRHVLDRVEGITNSLENESASAT
jgi:hypothetical protein